MSAAGLLAWWLAGRLGWFACAATLLGRAAGLDLAAAGWVSLAGIMLTDLLGLALLARRQWLGAGTRAQISIQSGTVYAYKTHAF